MAIRYQSSSIVILIIAFSLLIASLNNNLSNGGFKELITFVSSTPSPTGSPTPGPSHTPTTETPTKVPTKLPTATPTIKPTVSPSISPSKAPTQKPSKSPTKAPTRSPIEGTGVTSINELEAAINAASGYALTPISLLNDIIVPPNRSPSGVVIPAGKSVEIFGYGFKIDGNQATRVFTVERGARLFLNGVRITNGRAFYRVELEARSLSALENAQGSEGSYFIDESRITRYKSCGGGILNLGTLNVVDCVFQDNQSRCGGAIYNQGEIIEIDKSHFLDNTATYTPENFDDPFDNRGDDGIYGYMSRADAASNPAFFPFEGGGAIMQTSYLPKLNEYPDYSGKKPGSGKIGNIKNTEFRNNKAFQRGGAIFIGAGKIDLIDNCIFEGNRAHDESRKTYSLRSVLGGAIAVITQLPYNGDANFNGEGYITLISNSKFYDNAAEEAPDYSSNGNPYVIAGGAIYAGIADDASLKNTTREDPGTFDFMTVSNAPRVIGSIENTEFKSNYVRHPMDQVGILGGALAVGGIINNIDGCLFEYNKAPYLAGVGGAISFIGEMVAYIIAFHSYEGKIQSIRRTSFIGNSASSGGAIDTKFGSFDNIDRCIFRNNYVESSAGQGAPLSTPGEGGALRLHIPSNGEYVPPTVSKRFNNPYKSYIWGVYESQFYNNSAVKCAGAICASSINSLYVSSSVFEENTVQESSGGSGAINIKNATLDMNYSNFTSNIGDKGGAVGLKILAEGKLTYLNFVSNNASTGGAVYFDSGSGGTVTNSTFKSNVATSSCQKVSSCDAVGYVCGQEFQYFWEGCADGVGGAIYNAGQVTILQCVFDSSSIPNVPDVCATNCYGQENLAAVFYRTPGVDIHSKGRIRVYDSKFPANPAFQKYTRVSPIETVTKCNLPEACGPEASCYPDANGLSVTCKCEGVYASTNTNPYTAGCIKQNYDGTISAAYIGNQEVQGLPGTYLPNFRVSWTWNSKSNQGMPEEFRLYVTSDQGLTETQFILNKDQRNFTLAHEFSVPIQFKISSSYKYLDNNPTAFTEPLIICKPGSVPLDDKTSCRVCPSGTYQNGIVCSDCEDGLTYTPPTGATNSSECYAPKGKFKYVNQKTQKAVVSLCPPGGVCYYDATTVESLILSPGYWRPSRSSLKIRKCIHENYCWGGTGEGWEWGPNGLYDESLRSLVPGQPGNEETFDPSKESGSKNRRMLGSFHGNLSYCRPYHTGPFCEACIEGYSIKNGTCKSCITGSSADDAVNLAVQIVGLSIVLIVAAFGFLMYQRRQLRIARAKAQEVREKGGEIDGKFEKKVNELSDIMIKVKIVLGFAQVASSFGVTFQDAYPPEVMTVLDRLSVVNIDFTRYLSFGCSLKTDHYSRLTFYMIVPVVFLFLIFVAWGVFHFLNRSNPDAQRDIKRSSITAILFLTFLIYPGVSVVVFKTFKCDEFETDYGVERYLRADYTINCDSPDRAKWIAVAVLGVIMYPVGIVLLYAGLLYRAKDKLQPKTENGGWGEEKDEVILALRDTDPEVAHLKFLFHAYEPPYFYFEAFELVRKLFQTSLVLFVLEGSSTQIVITMLICYVSLAALYTVSPYVGSDDDNLAVASQWGLVLSSLAALLYKLDVAETDGYTESVINAVMFASLIASPAIALYYVVKTIYTDLPPLGRIFCCCLHKTSVSRKEKRKSLVGEVVLAKGSTLASPRGNQVANAFATDSEQPDPSIAKANEEEAKSP